MQDNSEFILRWAKKIKAIETLGGACLNCGCRDPILLDFHHKDNNKENDKEHIISQLLSLRWSKIFKEISKCQLLCANCHVEHHNSNEGRHNKPKKKWLNSLNTCQCNRCSHSTLSLASLEFHHKLPENKAFDLGDVFNRNQKVSVLELKRELEKCEIICRNCHRKEHFDSEKFNELKYEIYKKAISYKEKSEKLNKEIVCDMYFNKGMKQHEIRKELNCAKSTICEIIKNRTVV